MDRSSISVDFSMSDNEISKCEKYIGGVDKMLEWGAGGSTLYFSSMVGKFVSIENDTLIIETFEVYNEFMNRKYIADIHKTYFVRN